MAMRGVLSKADELDLTKPARAATHLANVVVAVDACDASRHAIALAARVAAMFGSRLHLVHAIDCLSHGPPSSVLDETRISEAFAFAEGRLEEERATLRASHASSIECVRLGHAASEVVGVAKERGGDLIVTGTRDRPGAHRLSGDSTAGEIVRRSHVPVLVAHEGEPLPPAGSLFRRPLAAIDYGDASAAALKTAMLLARGETLALHVIPEDPAWKNELAPANRHARARAIAQERERLGGWKGKVLREAGHGCHAVVGAGDPASVLVDAVAGGGHDLVACGTHARRARSPGHLGSVAEALLDAVTCPVLVLREAIEPAAEERGS